MYTATSTPSRRQPSPLAALRRRYRRGEAVTVAEAFAAARLTPQEQRVLRERLAGGRSFGDIGRQLGVSRQRAAQIEADARRKLGVRESLAAAVHDDERTERALRLLERGRRVRGELHADPEAARRRVRVRPERWEVEHEARVRAFLTTAV